MKYFNCDYNEGAHEHIIQKLVDTNLEQTPGYGEDSYCQSAADRIREACDADVEVHFLVGGTQTNLTAISSILRPHQGVICADSGHINTHESGAIENCGHKVLTVPTTDGKLTAAQITQVYQEHMQDETRIHTVQPGMVYISNPTEWGTTYSRTELEQIHQVCVECGLIFYIDGARLAYALGEENGTVDLPVLASCCDLFYIGGTKCGALFGEALVIINPNLRKDFRYLIKQKGAMLAKGRLLGIQFETLFMDGLYQEIGRHGVLMAAIIRTACVEAGYQFFIENGTNQVFPVLPQAKLKQLEAKYSFQNWGPAKDGKQVVRFCTSWATRAEDVCELAEDIKKA